MRRLMKTTQMKSLLRKEKQNSNSNLNCSIANCRCGNIIVTSLILKPHRLWKKIVSVEGWRKFWNKLKNNFARSTHSQLCFFLVFCICSFLSLFCFCCCSVVLVDFGLLFVCFFWQACRCRFNASTLTLVEWLWWAFGKTACILLVFEVVFVVVNCVNLSVLSLFFLCL